MYILGAGMAGCLAAIANPQSVILEGAEKPRVNHHALLRMRTPQIWKMTGIEFKSVIIQKYIYENGNCHKNLTPKIIVDYSRKTNGKVTDRSITDLKTEQRYIPPDDFHMRLFDMLDGRIKFGQNIHTIGKGAVVTKTHVWETTEPIISTLPMAVNLEATGISHQIDFKTMGRPIYVTRLELADYDLNITVYFPDPSLKVYRASIVGSTLIIESTEPMEKIDMVAVCLALSMGDGDVEKVIMTDKCQENGKIQPVEDGIRKTLLHQMTVADNLYSLGRFACWRQLILDDIVHDIAKIKQMIITHPYDRSLT